MTNTVVTDKADCLAALGRYDEAADLYEQSIRIDQDNRDSRGVAVGKGQLATVRRLQRRHHEALEVYAEVRAIFQQLGEQSMVAVAWHQIGWVHEDIGHYEAAERAY